MNDALTIESNSKCTVIWKVQGLTTNFNALTDIQLLIKS